MAEKVSRFLWFQVNWIRERIDWFSLSYLWVSRGYGLSRGSRYRQIDTIQDEIRRLDNQKEVSIEKIKVILIKFISRTENEMKKIQKLKRMKRKIHDGKERKFNGRIQTFFRKKKSRILKIRLILIGFLPLNLTNTQRFRA